MFATTEAPDSFSTPTFTDDNDANRMSYVVLCAKLTGWIDVPVTVTLCRLGLSNGCQVMETVYDPAATLTEYAPSEPVVSVAAPPAPLKVTATSATGRLFVSVTTPDTVTFAAQLGEASNTTRNALISATVARPAHVLRTTPFYCRTVSVRRTRSCRSPDQG